MGTRFDVILPKKAETVFKQPPKKELTGGSAGLQSVRAHLINHLTKDGLSRAATNLSAIQEKLAGRTGPVSGAFRQFIEHQLGNEGIESSRVAAAFAELTGELRRVAGLSWLIATVRDFAKRVEDSGASKLAARIRSLPVGQAGEGAGDSRLAIECDGDEFHGPDRWKQDMNRQRVLERAGWTFWRCFASTWSLHKEDVFSELLECLKSLGIEPMGALDRVPLLVEKRVWSSPPSKKDEIIGEALESAIGQIE